MDNRILKAWTTCAGRAVLSAALVLLGLIILAGLVLIAIFLPLDVDLRPLVIAAGLFIFFIFSIAGVLAWGFLSIRSRASQLDAAFLPLGLSGRGYLTVGRQYHGSVGGRQADIYFSRGPVLELYLSSAVHTRFYAGLKSKLGAALARYLNLGYADLSAGDPAFEDLAVTALDETWGRDLLEQPGVREASCA